MGGPCGAHLSLPHRRAEAEQGAGKDTFPAADLPWRREEKVSSGVVVEVVGRGGVIGLEARRRHSGSSQTLKESKEIK